MNRIRHWRLQRGLTLDQLAAKAGTTNQQVSRLEKSERRLTLDWMLRLAAALEIEAAELLVESGPAKPAAAVMDGLPAMIPVRSAARGGSDQEMFLDDPIDHIPRPAVLSQVRDAYSVYVVGDSMVPRYRAGFLLHVNPFKLARAESGVVVYKRNRAVLIKEFVELTPSHLVLRQFNPAEILRLPRDELAEWHTVVGTQEV